MTAVQQWTTLCERRRCRHPLTPHMLIRQVRDEILPAQIASFRHDFAILRDRQRDVAPLASGTTQPFSSVKGSGAAFATTPPLRKRHERDTSLVAPPSVSSTDHFPGNVISMTSTGRNWPPSMRVCDPARACRSSLEKLDPVQCYLRGLGQVYQWSKDGINNALSMFHKANELDPEFAPAYGMAAYCYAQRKSYGWIGNRQKEITECESLAMRH
jgi:hypothetical protein